MEVVIAACISAGVTLLICIINNKAEQSKTRALLEYKLDQLQKRVDLHNNVIERTYKLEGQMMECFHEIKDLKAYHKPN